MRRTDATADADAQGKAACFSLFTPATASLIDAKTAHMQTVWAAKTPVVLRLKNTALMVTRHGHGAINRGALGELPHRLNRPASLQGPSGQKGP